jgi:hypothetical protein
VSLFREDPFPLLDGYIILNEFDYYLFFRLVVAHAQLPVVELLLELLAVLLREDLLLRR